MPINHEMPSVSIILLNYNNYIDTIACLNSLGKISYQNYNIILVDNSSTDLSFEKLQNEISQNWSFQVFNSSLHFDDCDVSPEKKIYLIESSVNGGFGHGNNIGISFAIDYLQSDYVLLLNNDTEVEEGFLEPLVGFSENNPRAGIVSGKINYFEHKSKIWFNGGSLNLCLASVKHYNFRELDEGQEPPGEITFLSGCLWLISNKVIQQVGLIDEDYFMYVEDMDYCARVLKSNYSLDVVTESKIYHKVGSTSGGLFTDFRVYWQVRNTHIFINRFSPNFLCRLIAITLFNSRFLFKILKIRKISLLRSYLKGLLA